MIISREMNTFVWNNITEQHIVAYNEGQHNWQ